MGLLQSFERNLPNDNLAIDILTFKSKSSRGRLNEQHMFIVYVTFSHYLIARPLTSRALEPICDEIIRHVILPFGAPKRFICDNEFFKRNFTSLMTMLKAKAHFTTPYHSNGNPAERPLRHIQALLRIWVNCDSYFDDSTQSFTEVPPREPHENFSKFGAWPEYLPLEVAAYNASIIPGTDITPFELVFGRPYRLAADNSLADASTPALDTPLEEHWQEKQRILAELFDKVRTVHREHAALRSLHHSMDHVFLELQPKDLVIVRVPTREGKLAMQFIGPCKVVKKLSEVTYIVRDLRTSRDMRVHVQRLCRYHADSRYGPPYGSLDETNADAAQPSAQQGNLYWPDSDELKEKPFDDQSLVILRSQYSQRIVIGEVLSSFPDTNEIELHLYMHEPDQSSPEAYDLHMPLGRRRLAPEYTYLTKKGDVRAVGTYKPKPYWEPESQIFNLARMDVLARDVTLTDDMRIPARILDDIRRQYDIE